MIDEKTVADFIQEIVSKRAEIKNEFIKAWFAFNVPDEILNRPDFFKHFQLVECRSEDGNKITWRMEPFDY